MTSFVTAKGSIYNVVNRIKTQRFKEKRIEHGSDWGRKNTSELTVYINPEDAREFGDAQGLSPIDEFVVDVDGRLKRVRLLTLSYGKWGIAVKWKLWNSAPEVGLAPLEMFGRKPFFRTEPNHYYFDNWHPGNRIVRIEY